MKNIPQFVAEKNKRYGDAFRLLVEINYDDAGGGQFFRICRSSVDIVFEGHTWTAFGIGNPVNSQNSSGRIPTFDLPISNVGRVAQGLFESYIVEGRPGRLVVVHADQLADPTAKDEEKFVVQFAICTPEVAAITCRQGPNWLTSMVPAKVVTRHEFPGVLGSRSKYF